VLRQQMCNIQQDFKSYDESVKEVFEKVKQVRRADERMHNEEDVNAAALDLPR
jgi:hypothetical protein